MIKELIYQILLIGFIQGLIFNLYALFTSRYRTKSFLYINLWIFFLALNNLQAWWNEKEISLQSVYLDHLHTPWYIFLAPMFYLFLSRYLQYPKSRWVLNVAILFFSISFLVKSVLLMAYSEADLQEVNRFKQLFNSFEEPIGFILTISIFTYTYIIYRKVDKTYLIRSYESLEWVRRFFIYSVIGLFIWFLGVFHNIFFHNHFTENFYALLRLLTSLLLYWIAYKSTVQQRLFDERTAIRKNQKKQKQTPTRNETFSEEFNAIENVIDAQQLYTDPYLSVESLSDKLEVSASKLSKLIKQYTGSNFSEYINLKRVEKAKELLNNPEFTNYTILSIGLESGFNSKSVFYNVFKKYTELTPVQWKNNLS
jgi:AraC-like DNA-binding protein